MSNCHTLHRNGYIVNTKEGLSTNIGKDCGKTYFGVDFVVQSKQYDRNITESENRTKLLSFALQVTDIERRINELRHQSQGADWVHKKTRPLLNATSGCPHDVVRQISAMIRTGNNLLTKEREASASEIEDMEAKAGRTLPRPQFISDPLAEILGVQALYGENDLKDLLVFDLETHLGAFKNLIVEAMTYEQLRHWVKWANAVETTIEKATAAVAFGRQLLTEKNLMPFAELLDRKDKALFKNYLATLN